MPFTSAVTLALAVPLRATVAPALLEAGLSVPEMVQVCGGFVVDWPTFAPAVPQPPMNRDTTDRQTTKIPSLKSLSLTGTLVLFSAWPLRPASQRMDVQF